jgi:CheY-like chemotaxis protein
MGLLDGLTVLYLEDDADAREVMVLGLEHHGARDCDRVRPGCASAGRATSSRRYRCRSGTLGPGTRRWMFIRAVRDLPAERERRTPAIALSAHNTPADKGKSVSAGFTIHFAKPLAPDELATRIALLVKRLPRPREDR